MFPQMWWDSHKEQSVIVHPDAYLLSQVEEKQSEIDTVNCNSLAGKYGLLPQFQWKHKMNKALFRGATTGEFFDENKQFIGRAKLMNMSLSNPDQLEVWFSRIVDGHDDIEEYLPKEK